MMRVSECVLALWQCCCCLLLLAAAEVTDPSEVSALLAVKKQLIDPENHLINWNKGDPCTSDWAGVLCISSNGDEYSHVQELHLLNMNLSGTLAPELGKLSYLSTLDFMWNKLSGSIPKEIGYISTLNLLLLNGNNLSGSLPDEFGYLSNLGRFQIDENNISGQIPKAFANLSSVKHLHLNNNSLSGPIPPELSQLSRLLHVFFDNNNLSGYLPPEFSNLPELRILQLDNNNFNGSIPASYGNFSKLVKLSLRNCNLQGAVPDLSRIPSLTYLDLSRNHLTGPIPSNKLSDNLTTIDLSDNKLNESIPASFSDLPSLQTLSLENNFLSGAVPTNIWQNMSFGASATLELDFRNNSFSRVQGHLNPPMKVTLRLGDNPVCRNVSLLNISLFCGSQSREYEMLTNLDKSTADCLKQACPADDFFEYVPASRLSCLCAAPLRIGYRLKSPSFSYFPPYIGLFVEYLTSSLDLAPTQLSIDTYYWEKGRLRMHLKLFPSLSTVFDDMGVQQIRSMYTSWSFPDRDLFGPYELLNFTLLGPYANIAEADKKTKFPLVAGLGIAGAVLAGIGIGILILLYRRRNQMNPPSSTTNLPQLKDNKKVKALIEKYGSLSPKRYSYSDIKKMTRTFEDKLGQGGYGSVYKGKLPDGKLIAVKVLSESKGNGEEFINEVISISRTSHVNIVKLVGFCYENSKRALIYEYMSNGSLDGFIYDKKHQHTSTNLEWTILYQITLGIARGLEYLHQGCDTRILHLDIKPHNILLDEEFRPRIADFGLAKLCQRQESIVSMLGARGTAGYMAPEVYNRSFGGVSYKSDVYSFGMMVLEMAGGRKNIDVNISHTSEIYFPHWIHKQLEVGQDLKLRGIVTPEDEQMARKMILVGLWCIQIYPSDRPSMTKVLEMLEGGLESLQTPPQPYMSSPAREQQIASPSSTS